jgi:hypothetical protein
MVILCCPESVSKKHLVTPFLALSGKITVGTRSDTC